MRKYKHKSKNIYLHETPSKTHYVVISCGSNDGTPGDHIPKYIVEDSEDWIEDCVPKILFTTEDGAEITENYKYTLYSCLREIKQTTEQILCYSVAQAKTYIDSDRSGKATRLFFVDKIACERYLLNNIPVYTRNQILKALDKYNLISTIDGSKSGTLHIHLFKHELNLN